MTHDANTNPSSQEQRPSTSYNYNYKKEEKTQMSMHNIGIDDYAFLIGPRRDGIIKRKDGTALAKTILVL
jgi:hypothetical protein